MIINRRVLFDETKLQKTQRDETKHVSIDRPFLIEAASIKYVYNHHGIPSRLHDLQMLILGGANVDRGKRETLFCFPLFEQSGYVYSINRDFNFHQINTQTSDTEGKCSHADCID